MTNLTRRVVSKTLVAVAASALLAAASAASAADDHPTIKIGSTMPLTGTGAFYGQLMLRGLELGLKDASAQQGVNFDLISRDDEALAGPAVQEARRLMGDEGVPVMVTAYSAPPLAQLKIAEQYKVPLLNGGGNASELAGKTWLFNNAFMVQQGGFAMMTYAHNKLGAKKIGILVDTNYPTTTGDAYRQTWKDIAGGDVTPVFIPFDATDAGPYLDKVLADQPDALFLSVGGSTLSLVLTQLTQRNLSIPVISNDAAVISAPEANTAPFPCYYASPSTTASDKLMAEYKAQHGDAIAAVGTANYNLGLIIGQVYAKLKAANKPITGPNFFDVLNDPSNVYEVDGGIKVSFNKEHIVAQDALIVKVDHGKSTVVATGIPTTND